LTVNVFVPLAKVGVEPITPPLPWIVKLWGTGELLEKWTVTFPAFAVSELFVNFNCPLGSAASLSVLDPPAPPACEVVVEAGAAELLEDVGAAELLEDELDLLDPPQPAAPSANVRTTVASAVIFGIGKFLSSDGIDRSELDA
jgi:hypothetical protein